MTARNNLLLILKPEEYDQLVEQGLLRSYSASSISSDISIGSNSGPVPSRMQFTRRKEVYSSGVGSGSSRVLESSSHLSAGAHRPNQPGLPALRTAKHGLTAETSKSGRITPVSKGDFNIITNIPEGERYLHSDSEEDEDESLSSYSSGVNLATSKAHIVPEVLSSSKQIIHRGGARGSFIKIPPESSTRPKGVAPGLVSKTPPQSTRPSFQKPQSRGHRLVPAKLHT